MHWLPWWASPAAYCVLLGWGCGWIHGYVHRELIEWGRRCARLLAWQRRHPQRRQSWRGVWR